MLIVKTPFSLLLSDNRRIAAKISTNFKFGEEKSKKAPLLTRLTYYLMLKTIAIPYASSLNQT